MTTQKMLNSVNGQDTHSDKVCALIKTIISNYYQLPLDIYESKSRVRQVIRLKQASVYFMRKLLPKATLHYIGNQMMYDHATVLHCLKKVNQFLETKDLETTEDIRKINEMVELKHEAIMFGKEAEKGFYHISLDKCTSLKLPNGQAMVFSGMLPNQIAVIREFLEKHYAIPLPTRKHTKTGLFILERLNVEGVGGEVSKNQNTIIQTKEITNEK